MFWYILTALLFIAYLEVTGRLLLYKLNIKKHSFAFPFGLLFLMAYGYITTSILTHINCSFYIVLAIFGIYFVVSLILLFKNIKKIDFSFNITNVIIILVFAFVMLFYAYNTTLGDSSGFDSVYYLNLISTNIGASKLNTTDLFYGTYNYKAVSNQYSFQTYFYFVSCFDFIVLKILSKFCEANYYSITIWVFQILYNFFLCSLVINAFDTVGKNKKLLKYVILFIFLFFFGKIYYNSVYGFYGNTFRTVAIGYCTLTLYELLKQNNKNNWIIFAVAIIGSCAFSSSAVFTIIFLLYAAYFVLVDKEDNLFKYYAVILFLPFINLITVVVTDKTYISVIISFLLCLLMWAFNDKLIEISRMKYTKKIFLVAVFILMVFLSYTVTGNFLDTSAVLNNHSEVSDMSMNYFSFIKLFGINELYFKIIIWVLLVYSIVFENKNSFVVVVIVLLVSFFNTLTAPILYRYNIVYHRALDIIVNPFTFVLYFDLLFNRINNKKIYYVALTSVLCLFAINVEYAKPYYYHESFIADEDYNSIMKMTNDEYGVIKKLKEEIEYSNKNAYIVTPNIFTESFIPSCTYMYGRNYEISNDWSYAEYQIYSIFYPVSYFGEARKGIKADYDNLAKYLKESNIDYLVIDKTLEYYDDVDENYKYLIYKVAECGYGYSIYSNDRYEIFYFERNN